MTLPLWTILVATFGVIWWLRNKLFKRNENKLGLKEIPGPKGLPLIGSLYQLGTNPNEQFCKWSEEYGNIYKVNLGSYTTTVISDPKWAKELFSADWTTGRLSSPVYEVYQDEPGLGIGNSENERWNVHRRFLLRQLRDFGFGKSSMEALIMDEVNEILEMYKKKAGTPVGDIKNTLKLAVVNSLWTILTSKRFKQDDPRLMELAITGIDGFNEIVEKGSWVDYIPSLAYILPEWSGYNGIRKVFTDIRMFMEKAVSEHKAQFRPEDRNCFLDSYMAEMKKAEKDTTSLFHGDLAERQLVSSLFDLFLAGTDTQSSTLAWTVLLLTKYPKMQERLQNEISEITGDLRKVSIDDRPNMPYTVALIDEILRFTSIVPDGVLHRSLEDHEFKGYFIPKDSNIQPNLYFIHHNPNIWGDPENFRPERFLSDDGKKYVSNSNLQSFQPGRRQCPGETLARDSIFLYMTNLFQQFNMKFDPKAEKEPTLEAEVGMVRAPLPYNVIMEQRLHVK